MYDAEAVTVASLVAELGRFGIEPRHLRLMKAAADREGRAGRPGGGPAQAPPQPADQGARRGPYEGAGGPHGEAARGPRADRSGRAAALSRRAPGAAGSGTCSRPDYPNVPGTALGLLCERARCRRCPGRNALQPADRAPARSGGDRYLPHLDRTGEATAIAFAQQGMAPARPLTHDLFRGRAGGRRPGADRSAHHRSAGRRLLRGSWCSPVGSRSAPAPPMP